MVCEIHFREGFTGEVVEVTVAGERRVRRELRTRLQIGLAHIEELIVQPGQVAVIALPVRGLSASIEFAPTDHWITVDLEDDALVVGRAASSPGYV